MKYINIGQNDIFIYNRNALLGKGGGHFCVCPRSYRYIWYFFLCSIIRYLRELFIYLVLIELLTITVLVSFHHCNM